MVDKPKQIRAHTGIGEEQINSILSESIWHMWMTGFFLNSIFYLRYKPAIIDTYLISVNLILTLHSFIYALQVIRANSSQFFFDDKLCNNMKRKGGIKKKVAKSRIHTRSKRLRLWYLHSLLVLQSSILL